MVKARLERIVSAVFGGNSAAAAQAIGVEPSTLHRLINGKVGEGRVSTLARIAHGYGVPLAWLIGEASSEAAQAREEPLPESLWLLHTFHKGRQRADRERLVRAAETMSGERAAMARKAARINLWPLDKASPLSFLSPLIPAGRAPRQDDLTVVRHALELESEIVAMAAKKLANLSTE